MPIAITPTPPALLDAHHSGRRGGHQQARPVTHVGMESTSIYRVLDDHIDATRRRSKI
jgi:hypothetical protein